MIICNSKKFIYIHIPKCGGTSVSSVLERYLLPQDITLNLNPHDGWQQFLDSFRKRYGLHKHSTAAEIGQAMKPENFKEYYAFTFCRNPFARAYSAYTFTLKADALYRPESQRYQEIKDMSFEEFLASRYVQNRELMPTRLQISWLRGGPAHVQPYRLENIDRALAYLVRRFFKDGEMVSEVPRANPSVEIDAWTKMSPEAEAIIRDHYAEDFKTFQYPDQIPR